MFAAMVSKKKYGHAVVDDMLIVSWPYAMNKFVPKYRINSAVKLSL
jgi:hypothetical protein